MHDMRRQSRPIPLSVTNRSEILDCINSDLNKLAQLLPLLESHVRGSQLDALARTNAAIVRGLDLVAQLSTAADQKRRPANSR